MRAMILAAGRGERMRPLTDSRPKPLLEAGGQALIVWNIQKLLAAGIKQIMINHAWLGQQIEAQLGDGSQWGASLHYSAENPALETAGGIAKALPFFQNQRFLVINADVWTDWDAAQAHTMVNELAPDDMAQLVLVPNPEHHPKGDFNLAPHMPYIQEQPTSSSQRYTFSGIGVYDPRLFNQLVPEQSIKMATLLHQAIGQQHVQARLHTGVWMDIGTPERLAQLERHLETL